MAKNETLDNSDNSDWDSHSSVVSSDDEDTENSKEVQRKPNGGRVSASGWRIAGDNNLAKATRARVKDRDQIPEEEEDEFDETKIAELKQRLKKKKLRTSGSKVQLWQRLQGRELKNKPQAGSSKAVGNRASNTSPRVRGNNNFKLAAQRSAIGRDGLSKEECQEFDNTNIAELKAWLKMKGMKVSGSKIDLWRRWKLCRDENNSEDEEDSEDEDDKEDEDSSENEDTEDTENTEDDKDKEDEGDDTEESDDALEANYGDEVEDEEPNEKRESSQSKRSKRYAVERDEEMRQVSQDVYNDKEVVKTNLKKRRNSDNSSPEDNRRPVKHRVVQHPEFLQDGSPTEYNIPKHLLDKTITEILTVAPESLREGPPSDSNDNMTLCEYLQRNTEH